MRFPDILPRRTTIRAYLLTFAALLSTLNAFAQAPKPEPDRVVFINGEVLTGTLEKVDSKTITFKSLMAGEVTFPWVNVKELQSAQTFAVIKAKQMLTRKDALAEVASGSVSADDNKAVILKSPTSTQTIPLADVAQFVPTADFNKALKHVGLTQGWAGTASAGVSLVRSTQDSTTFNGAIALVRALPQVSWLPPRSQTSIGYNQSYGTTSQSGDPTVKTNIFHAGIEQDEYFSPKLFVLADGVFDHNFSSNLNLQQAYGVGIGLNIIKNPKQQLDVKVDLHYEKQSFFNPTTSDNLVGSTFSETYLRNLPKKLVFTEFGSFTPAWNNSSDYSAHINGALGFPVYKGLGFSIVAIDDYLNNAPPGANKNSSQFNMNLTYTIKPR